MRELIVSIPYVPTGLIGKEAEIAQLCEQPLKEQGYTLVQVILGHLTAQTTQTTVGPFMHTFSSPNFPACTSEDLDAKKGKLIALVSYKLGSSNGLLGEKLQLANFKPISLRKYLQTIIKSNAAESTWENILMHKPSIRSIYSPKQAGELLATRLRIIFSRKSNKIPNWTEEPSVKFCLLQPIDSPALIKGLFKPKFDYTTGKVTPPDTKAIRLGISILGYIRIQMQWNEADLQKVVLETLGKNINWWQKEGLSFHHAAGILMDAQEALQAQTQDRNASN